MAGTKPTGEQLLFRSTLTGDHVLDSYLEACEQGSRTLAAKLQDLYTTDTGVLRSGLVQLRVADGTQELQSRFGTFADDSGWQGIGAYIGRYQGVFAPAVDYLSGDYVSVDGKVWLITEGHTSGATFDETKGVALTSLTPNIEALGGVVSAADTLPYFDGDSSADTTTLTALARSLLAGATEAEMRTTLGLSGSSDSAIVVGDGASQMNLLTLNGGHISDAGNDYGLTINSYEPGIALVDRSTGAGSAMLHSGHDGELVILTDTTNDGTIGHNSNTTDATMAHFSRDFIALWTTNSGTPEERLRITNYGRVGIGTASPSTLLHLSDNNPIITLTDENTGVDHLLSGSSSSGAFLLHVDANSEHGSAALFLKVRNTNAITAKADGKIGFGLIDPVNELQINTPDAATGSDAFIRVGLNASYASLLIGYAGEGDPADEAPAVYASNTTGTTGGAGNLVLKARGGGTVRDIIFHAGATSDEVMRLTGAGRLGIGTDSPSAPLHVRSSAPSVMLSDSDGTDQYGVIEQAGGSLILQSRNSIYVGAIVFRGQADSGVVEYGRFSAGRFGVGETSPEAYLHVSKQHNDLSARFERSAAQQIDVVQNSTENSIRSTGQPFALGTADANDIQFKRNSVTKMTLNNSGLDMEGGVIYNTASPVSDDELANKAYVDSVFVQDWSVVYPDIGLAFMNSAEDSATNVCIVPNGSSSVAGVNCFGNRELSDPYMSYTFFGHIGGRGRISLVSGSSLDAPPLKITYDGITRFEQRHNGATAIGAEVLSEAIQLHIKGSGSTNNTSSLYVQNSLFQGLFQVADDGRVLLPATFNLTTTTAAPNVHMDGNGALWRSTAASSSLRYKQNVRDMPDIYRELFMSLRPVVYELKEGDPVQQIGFIAEEVHDAGLSELVMYDEDNRPDALHYANMVALLTKVVQKQSHIIDDLIERVHKLETL